MRSLIELVATVAVAVLIAFLVQAFLIKPYRIPSGSMIPTLDVGQRILVNRLDTQPGLGDVVVFHPPAGADPVPSVCGDSAEGASHRAMCDRGSAAESGQTFVKRVVGLPGDRLSLRDGRLYRNGHLERVRNAQPCGTDPQDCNMPQTITVPRGDYFMMGDNRSISDDSRYWGPVPQRWVIGVAVATYWPLDRIGIF